MGDSKFAVFFALLIVAAYMSLLFLVIYIYRCFNQRRSPQCGYYVRL